MGKKLSLIFLILFSFLLHSNGMNKAKKEKTTNSMNNKDSVVQKQEGEIIQTKLVWQGNLDPRFHESSRLNAVGDITGDGKAEIVHFDGTYDREKRAYSGKIKIFQWMNTELQRIWISMEDFSGVRAISVGDIDKDGKNEIIIGLNRKVLIFKWEWNNLQLTNSVDFTERKVAVTGDVDNKREKPIHRIPPVVEDIATGILSKQDKEATLTLICLIRDPEQYRIESYSVSEGGIKPEFEMKETVETMWGPAQLLIGDINNDGNNELIIMTVWTDTSTVGAFFLNPETDPYFYKKIIPGGYAMGLVGIIDVDGDKKNEIVTYGSNYSLQLLHTILVYKWEEEVFSFSFFKQIDVRRVGSGDFVWVGDLLGDGKLKVVLIKIDDVNIYELVL